MARAEIELDAVSEGQLLVDGTDISGAAGGLTLTTEPGRTPRLTVDLHLIRGLRADLPAHVTVPDATRAALVALGWTPPTGE